MLFVSFLGHIISDEGDATEPEKVNAVQEWPVPISQTEIRSFLGLCGYYRRFIKGYAEIAKPLHTLTEKGRPFVWTEECQYSFDKLKKCLTEAPVLAFPDFTKEFILDTDASGNSIGAVLSQKIDGKERVICFGSRTLSKCERRHSITRREMLSVFYFIGRFRHYLLGRKFVIRTDHSALKNGKRKVQGVPQSQTAALPRHQEEEETDKSKQAQIEQNVRKTLRLALSSPSEVIAILKGLKNTRTKWHSKRHTTNRLVE